MAWWNVAAPINPAASRSRAVPRGSDSRARRTPARTATVSVATEIPYPKATEARAGIGAAMPREISRAPWIVEPRKPAAAPGPTVIARYASQPAGKQAAAAANTARDRIHRDRPSRNSQARITRQQANAANAPMSSRNIQLAPTIAPQRRSRRALRAGGAEIQPCKAHSVASGMSQTYHL
jgi:hypothetical protein